MAQDGLLIGAQIGFIEGEGDSLSIGMNLTTITQAQTIEDKSDYDQRAIILSL